MILSPGYGLSERTEWSQSRVPEKSMAVKKLGQMG